MEFGIVPVLCVASQPAGLPNHQHRNWPWDSWRLWLWRPAPWFVRWVMKSCGCGIQYSTGLSEHIYSWFFHETLIENGKYGVWVASTFRQRDKPRMLSSIKCYIVYLHVRLWAKQLLERTLPSKHRPRNCRPNRTNLADGVQRLKPINFAINLFNFRLHKVNMISWPRFSKSFFISGADATKAVMEASHT